MKLPKRKYTFSDSLKENDLVNFKPSLIAN